MKRMSTLLFGLCATITLNAQIKFAPEAGCNLAFMRERSTGSGITQTMFSQLTPGFKAGLALDIKVTDHFYFQPAVFYVWHKIRFSRNVEMSMFGLPNEEYTRRVTIDYIRSPLYFMYKTGFDGMGRFFSGIGPYAGLAVGGYNRVRMPVAYYDANKPGMSTMWVSEESSLRLGNRTGKDQMKDLDYGMAATIGYESNVGLFFRAYYYYGLSNLAPSYQTGNTIRNWGTGFSIGVMLGKDAW